MAVQPTPLQPLHALSPRPVASASSRTPRPRHAPGVVATRPRRGPAVGVPRGSRRRCHRAHRRPRREARPTRRAVHAMVAAHGRASCCGSTSAAGANSEAARHRPPRAIDVVDGARPPRRDRAFAPGSDRLALLREPLIDSGGVDPRTARAGATRSGRGRSCAEPTSTGRVALTVARSTASWRDGCHAPRASRSPPRSRRRARAPRHRRRWPLARRRCSKAFRTLGAYAVVAGEIDPAPLIDAAWRHDGGGLPAPLTVGRSMVFAEWQPGRHGATSRVGIPNRRARRRSARAAGSTRCWCRWSRSTARAHGSAPAPGSTTARSRSASHRPRGTRPLLIGLAYSWQEVSRARTPSVGRPARRHRHRHRGHPRPLSGRRPGRSVREVGAERGDEPRRVVRAAQLAGRVHRQLGHADVDGRDAEPRGGDRADGRAARQVGAGHEPLHGHLGRARHAGEERPRRAASVA